MTATPLLEICDLHCERDDRALFTGLNLRLSKGELVQVVGPNGAGKTTLLRVLTGLSGEYDGEIRWCDKPVRDCRYEFASDLLYLGHHIGIKKALTPTENLAFYQSLSGGFTRAIPALLHAVNLAGYEHVPCDQLSAGQQRRVALARLYGARARLWILDEPFTAVDKTGVAALEQLLSAHIKGGGAVILTTHQSLNMVDVRELDLSRFAEGVA